MSPIGAAQRAFSRQRREAAIPDIPESGLLHAWNISTDSGPITDTEGSNDLSVVAGQFDDTVATWKGGWAFDTDGTDDVAEGSVVDTEQFTVCWWLYPRDNSTIQFPFYNGNGGDGNAWPEIRIDGNGNWRCAISSAGGSNYKPAVGNSVTTNDLILISARYDGSTLSLVENTTETGTLNEDNMPTQSATGNVTLGGRTDGGGGHEFYYDGIADWGLFYNEWKTESEIQQIYDAHPST